MSERLLKAIKETIPTLSGDKHPEDGGVKDWGHVVSYADLFWREHGMTAYEEEIIDELREISHNYVEYLGWCDDEYLVKFAALKARVIRDFNRI